MRKIILSFLMFCTLVYGCTNINKEKSNISLDGFYINSYGYYLQFENYSTDDGGCRIYGAFPSPTLKVISDINNRVMDKGSYKISNDSIYIDFPYRKMQGIINNKNQLLLTCEKDLSNLYKEDSLRQEMFSAKPDLIDDYIIQTSGLFSFVKSPVIRKWNDKTEQYVD